MKISTKSRYALRLCLDLAVHQKDGWIALKDISTRQDISKKYLEQIVQKLQSAGLLEASRGFQGGYRLTRSPAQITLAEVLRATESTQCLLECVHDAQCCQRSGQCLTRTVWSGLKQAIDAYVSAVTLQSILDQQSCTAFEPCPIQDGAAKERPIGLL